MIKINFLPWRKTQRQKRIKYVLLFLLCSLCIIILLIALFRHNLGYLQTIQRDRCRDENCLFSDDSISALTIVGTLIGNRHQWVFIANQHNLISKAQVNDLIGSQHLQIKKISQRNIELTESNERNKKKDLFKKLQMIS